jgi:hypothetical protein
MKKKFKSDSEVLVLTITQTLVISEIVPNQTYPLIKQRKYILKAYLKLEDVTQVVEHLPSNHKTISSNSSTINK